MTLYNDKGLPATPEEIREAAIETFTPCPGTDMTSPASTQQWLLAHFAGFERETFLVIYLDNRHRLIDSEELFQGTIDGASVWPREIIKSALKHNAAALILAHNHPSGVPEPSGADRRLTDRIRDACGIVDIRVLDHIIVGGGTTVSFAERGLI